MISLFYVVQSQKICRLYLKVLLRKKKLGDSRYNLLAIPNIEEIYGEKLQEISVLYLIALNQLHKQDFRKKKIA